MAIFNRYPNGLLLGQRVIVANEIGIVKPPLLPHEVNAVTQFNQVLVYRDSVGCSALFAIENVKSLPGGQL